MSLQALSLEAGILISGGYLDGVDHSFQIGSSAFIREAQIKHESTTLAALLDQVKFLPDVREFDGLS